MNPKRRKNCFKFQAPSFKKDKGFALLELLVVLFIFLIIIFVAIDIFMSILYHQQRVLDEQEILNQASYFVEYISRALRMAVEDETGGCLGLDKIGYNYALIEDPLTNTGKGIKFINHSDGDICQEFPWSDSDYRIKEKKGIRDFLPITPESLKINYFKVKIFGEAGSDIFQPRVTISMEIQAKKGENPPKRQIQTTISQRNLDGE